MTSSEHPALASNKRHSHWLVIFLAVAAGSMLCMTLVQLQNSRTLVSWHGFLHTAIANRFPGPFKTPENPFFAGEPVPYYWFHHYIASLIARVLHVHPIRAFQIITAAGLVILWASAGAIGVHRFKSLKAGLLIGFLVLTGVNPLGPVIAVSKYVVHGNRLLTHPQMSDIDTVFVTDRQSEDLMTQPLLGALYVTADWRRGQNLAWYIDISSRGIALALVFPLLLMFMSERMSWIAALSTAGIAAAMTAFSPLIGLAVVGSLFAGSAVLALIDGIRHGPATTWPVPSTLGLAAAAVLGAAAASPTYTHLFLVGGSEMAVLSSRETLMRTLALGLNVIVLLPMACWSALRATDRLREHYRILVLAACGLLLVVPFVSLTDDTEHNLANTAQCLLVIPAVALTVTSRVPWLTNRFLVCLFTPMAVASIASYLGRPPLPIAFIGSEIHRTSDDALDRLYRWIRASTSLNAVFICDPASPAKMSGNVAELPAFTGRTLFVDHASYLTTPHKHFERRRDMATSLLQGLAMSEPDATYLAALHRSVYLLSYRAEEPELIGRLVELYGAPVFHDRFVAVFDLTELARKSGVAR